MLDSYRNSILHFPNNKIIFAPNGSGKTIFSESTTLLDVASNDTFVIINKNNFLKLIEKLNKSSSKFKSKGDDGSFDLSLVSVAIPKILKSDFDEVNKRLNFLGIKIDEKCNGNLNELIFKKSKAKINFNASNLKYESIMRELQLSSSEFEYFILVVLLFSHKNIDATLILDDPIEFASFSNENRFIELISSLKFEKGFILLTHRISLFELLISSWRNFKHKIGKYNIKPSFYYLMDIQLYSIDFELGNFTENLYLKASIDNKIIERSLREDIKKKIIQFQKKYINKSECSYDQKGNHTCDHELCFLKNNKQQIDQIGSNKAPNENFVNDIFSKDIFKAINAKISFFTQVRLLINPNSKTLLDVLKSFKRKNSNDIEIKKLALDLNAINHHNNWWILYSELKIKETLQLLKDNILISKIKGLKELISIVDKKMMEKIEDIVHDFKHIEITNNMSDSSLPKHNGTIKFRDSRERELHLTLLDGFYLLTDDDGGGVCDFDAFNDILINYLSSRK